MKQENVVPAPQADDATVIRRLTLDLVGRIPTPAETKAYAESNDSKKKIQLIDRLIASPAFVRYQAVMFDAMLATPLSPRGSGSLRDYFTKAIGENRPWSQIFKEIVTPDEKDANQKGSVEFLKARITDLDRLTNEVSVVFFGVNVSCAQCHDHPLVNDWKQDHFFGMKTFFSRTFDNGGFLAEREFGTIKFKPNKGAEKLAKPMFLSGASIEMPNFREPNAAEQKMEKEKFDKAKTSKVAPAPPTLSARAKLVETALKGDKNEFFSRSIANRMWHRFFGFGLVNPLDQMHSENPPSHPELLQWLARDTATNNYDIRRLIRGIVSSEAYSRSSKSPSEVPPAPKFFAVARLKPLTPMQLATSMKIATTDPTSFENQKADDLEKKLAGLEGSAGGFASQIAIPTDDFQIGINEALLFNNSDRVAKEFLTENGGSLLGKVKELKDTNQAVDLMVRSVLCRPATDEEKQLLGDYIKKRSDRQLEACRQVVWALITSAEFRFNY
ncbi:MAG: DUF1549 and DUF1553 domain-containing protein [Planctomycetes bacterium]|nr:DUF1549 and DUF1553 domain-containing protein [Planctomycetota bacterium]